jgi:hypothetical protein
MYTELVLKCRVKDDIQENVEEVLQFLFNGGYEPVQLPDHHFFEEQRWTFIGRSNSYYHIPWNTSKYKEGYIFSRSDLKNYNGEIALFIDWIKPYLLNNPSECIGWQWYEEDDAPTLLYM